MTACEPCNKSYRDIEPWLQDYPQHREVVNRRIEHMLFQKANGYRQHGWGSLLKNLHNDPLLNFPEDIVMERALKDYAKAQGLM